MKDINKNKDNVHEENIEDEIAELKILKKKANILQKIHIAHEIKVREEELNSINKVKK